MLSKRTILAVAVSLFTHQYVQAACFNPLGCRPRTQQECIDGLSGTRTEAVAKAQLAQCYKLPRVDLALCEETEARWADYMRGSAGVEWGWPDSHWSTKQECQKQFPKMFAASKWVTRSFCSANSKQIRRNADLIDIESRKSSKLEQARSKLVALAQLDDRSFVEATQKLYYTDIPAAEIAKHLGIDAPADALGVSLACHQIAGGGAAVEWVANEIARRHNAGAAGARDRTVVWTEAQARGDLSEILCAGPDFVVR